MICVNCKPNTLAYPLSIFSNQPKMENFGALRILNTWCVGRVEDGGKYGEE